MFCHSVPATSNRKNMTKLSTGFHRLPFSNFRYSLTLFSKFFASFPHGTCALSVSHRYLALCGIYHTIWAAIPSNSTHWRHIRWHKDTRQEREYHPLSCPFPRDLARHFSRWYLYRPQFGAPINWLRRFTWWAIPASVALTRGILVSFFSSA